LFRLYNFSFTHCFKLHLVFQGIWFSLTLNILSSQWSFWLIRRCLSLNTMIVCHRIHLLSNNVTSTLLIYWAVFQVVNHPIHLVLLISRSYSVVRMSHFIHCPSNTSSALHINWIFLAIQHYELLFRLMNHPSHFHALFHLG
jgi:hypothetical protein